MVTLVSVSHIITVYIVKDWSVQSNRMYATKYGRHKRTATFQVAEDALVDRSLLNR